MSDLNLRLESMEASKHSRTFVCCSHHIMEPWFEPGRAGRGAWMLPLWCTNSPSPSSHL